MSLILEFARANQALMVAGASGTGKSSLVLAGAVPRLLAQASGWALARMRPSRDALPESELLALLQARDPPARPVLLVVDQSGTC